MCECVTVVIIKTALVAATRFTYLIFFATRHDYKQLSRYGCARGPQYLFVGITKKTRHGLDLGPRACTPRVGRGRFSPFPFSVVFPAFPWRARGYATRSDALRFFTRCFPFLVYRNAHFLAAVPAAVQYTTHTHTLSCAYNRPLGGSAGYRTRIRFAERQGPYRWVERDRFSPLKDSVMKCGTRKTRESRPRHGRRFVNIYSHKWGPPLSFFTRNEHETPRKKQPADRTGGGVKTARRDTATSGRTVRVVVAPFAAKLRFFRFASSLNRNRPDGKGTG